MYQVIGPTRTRTRRVLWALEELGQEYEHVREPPRSASVSSLNPSGKVPVLKVDGQIIIDSVAIVTFLADRHQGITFPAGTIERAQQDSLTQFIVDEIDACLWAAARHTFVLPEERRIPALKDTLKWEWARSIGILEGRLGDREFLAGDRFTIPDIVMTHCGAWARAAGFEIPEGPLRDYLRRMIKRPAYQTTEKD